MDDKKTTVETPHGNYLITAWESWKTGELQMCMEVLYTSHDFPYKLLSQRGVSLDAWETIYDVRVKQCRDGFWVGLLQDAGVPRIVIDALPESELALLHEHNFYGRILSGRYYNEIVATGIRNLYGNIETWSELCGNDMGLEGIMLHQGRQIDVVADNRQIIEAE